MAYDLKWPSPPPSFSIYYFAPVSPLDLGLLSCWNFSTSSSSSSSSSYQSVVMGCVIQHRKRALRTVVNISVSAFSSILTTSVKGGLASGLASQHRVMISLRTGKQSFGTMGRTPLLTTANAACTAVMFWKGSIPVINSQRTIPKLYTSTFCV